MTLELFYETLCKYKPLDKEYPIEEYDRYSFCTLVHEVEGKVHEFQMRGFRKKDDKIIIESCNWTLAAGVCGIHLEEKHLKNWKIKEEGLND